MVTEREEHEQITERMFKYKGNQQVNGVDGLHYKCVKAKWDPPTPSPYPQHTPGRFDRLRYQWFHSATCFKKCAYSDSPTRNQTVAKSLHIH